MEMRQLIIFTLLVLVLSSFGSAVSIGVSPGTIVFQDLLREGYAERDIRISTNSNEEITAHFTVDGPIKEWLRFEPNSTTFSMSSANPHILKVIAVPPNDTRSDFYNGNINFVTDYFGTPQSRAGGIVKAAVTLRMRAQITDTETRACRAGAFNFADAEIGFPLEMAYNIINDGNVRIKPLVRFEIMDFVKENILFSDDFTNEEVLPTVEERVVRKIGFQQLEEGQYWANIAIDECQASRVVLFNVVEKGAILDSGLLRGITNKVWTYVDEPVEIKATFVNSGPRIATSKFMGSIKLEDNIVEVIETDEVDVASGETVDLISFYTPKSPGRYVVTGRVQYNKKLTYEKGSVINVSPKQDGDGPRFTLLFIYLVILITIIFLVRRIMKSRKR